MVERERERSRRYESSGERERYEWIMEGTSE